VVSNEPRWSPGHKAVGDNLQDEKARRTTPGQAGLASWVTRMAIMDDLLAGNRRFLDSRWDPDESQLEGPPGRHLAVVGCMDTRYTIERVLGLRHGEAAIIRNAGNVIDDGTLRSLLVAVHLLEVDTIAIMGHTKCGMTQVGRGDFKIANSIAERTGVGLNEVMRPDFQRWLGGFTDVEENVRRSMEVLRRHPYLPDDVGVLGLLYDNDTGEVHPVTPWSPATRTTKQGVDTLYPRA
jgi:carbonic anhydrase